MKADLKIQGDQTVLALIPETDADQALLREWGLRLTRSHMVNCRGFAYLNPAVEFLIQPMPSRD